VFESFLHLKVKETIVYAKIVNVRENDFDMLCHLCDDVFEMRVCKKADLLGSQIFIGNILELRMTSGPGWMQIDHRNAPFKEEIINIFKNKENV